jgi:hypothetical protein
MSEQAKAIAVQRKFRVVLNHDNGKFVVELLASNARSAAHRIIAIERAPMRSVLSVHQRPTCDYCDQPGTRYVKDSGEGTPLCWADAVDHYDTATGAREATGVLGIRRLIEIPRAEWE